MPCDPSQPRRPSVATAAWLDEHSRGAANSNGDFPWIKQQEQLSKLVARGCREWHR
jgi:hypothetical protein